MHRLVLVRHGESQWNLENRFTGWTDVDLTPTGEKQAQEAGKLLIDGGFRFDLAYTSILKRAKRTLDIILNEMKHPSIPIKEDWRLNERHYGALQGLNKAETAEKYGKDQVHIWRRSFDTPPPALTQEDERFPGNIPLFSSIDKNDLPLTESLKDTVARFLPYWKETIAPKIKNGQKLIIAAHGNSLRALVMHLDSISEEKITQLNIPTGLPLVYELDESLQPIKNYYLGDADRAAQAAAAVANQLQRK